MFEAFVAAAVDATVREKNPKGGSESETVEHALAIGHKLWYNRIDVAVSKFASNPIFRSFLNIAPKIPCRHFEKKISSRDTKKATE